MNILAFDTCFDACSVAVGICEDGAITHLAGRFEPMATGQAERLIPMVSCCLSQAGLSMMDIDRIGVTTGPGTFTGTRIAISAAKGLALVYATPIVGLSSLQLIARQVALSAHQSRDICVAIDVRRDEVYIQLFDNSGMISKSGPSLMTLIEARQFALQDRACLAGSGAGLVAGEQADDFLICETPGTLLPDARHAIGLAYQIARSQTAIAPLYLRAPDAKPSSAAPLQRQ